MSKPSKFARRTGTISKDKRMKGLDRYFRNTKVISNQAKKAAENLEHKIDNEELDYCAYDCKERRHAHQEELKKKGKSVKKIGFNKFQALYGEKKLTKFNTLASRHLSLTPRNSLTEFSKIGQKLNSISNFTKIGQTINNSFFEKIIKPERELREKMALLNSPFNGGSVSFNKRPKNN